MFLHSTGAPSSSSLLASAVFPASAASQSARAIAFSFTAGVAMLSDVLGGDGGRVLVERGRVDNSRALVGLAIGAEPEGHNVRSTQFGNPWGSNLPADVDSTPTKQSRHVASSRHSLGPRGFLTACWGCPRRDSEGPGLLSTRLRRRPKQAALRQGVRIERFALPSVPCERSHSTPGPVAVGFEVV